VGVEQWWVGMVHMGAFGNGVPASPHVRAILLFLCPSLFI
jgi:hypothetical protein